MAVKTVVVEDAPAQSPYVKGLRLTYDAVNRLMEVATTPYTLTAESDEEGHEVVRKLANALRK